MCLTARIEQATLDSRSLGRVLHSSQNEDLSNHNLMDTSSLRISRVCNHNCYSEVGSDVSFPFHWNTRQPPTGFVLTLYKILITFSRIVGDVIVTFLSNTLEQLHQHPPRASLRLPPSSLTMYHGHNSKRLYKEPMHQSRSRTAYPENSGGGNAEGQPTDTSIEPGDLNVLSGRGGTPLFTFLACSEITFGWPSFLTDAVVVVFSSAFLQLFWYCSGFQ
jgi:hypothetical protein